jgi:hypothetical protein
VTADELEDLEPASNVVDLGAILERGPARVFRLPVGALRADSITVYELTTIGRTLGLSPAELTAAAQAVVDKRAGWEGLEVAQAFAWIVARRADPALTWAEAQTYGLEVVDEPPEDPTSPPGEPTPARSGQRST